MHLQIITLPYDSLLEGFDTDPVQNFCQNKHIHRLESAFFSQQGQQYWSVSIIYRLAKEQVAKPVAQKVRKDLNAREQLLFENLRKWRSEKASKEGRPHFLIATDRQFISMIKMQVSRKVDFEAIERFGKSRIQKYATELIDIIQNFYRS